MKNLFFIALILLIGCSSSRKTPCFISLKPVGEKRFKIEKNQKSFYYLTSLQKNASKNYLVTVDNDKGTIYKYDFESRQLVSTYTPTQCANFQDIFGKRKRKYLISEMNYINDDSIFLRFHLLYFNFKEKADSTFMLIDSRGNVKNIDSYKNVPILATENKNIDVDTCLYFAYPSDYNNYVSSQKIYLRPMERWGAPTIGDSVFKLKPTTIGGHMDLKYPEGKYISHKVYYPDIEIGHYYPKTFAEPLPILIDKCRVLYAWGYTSKVIIYDFIKHKIIKESKIGSNLIDSIPSSATRFREADNWKLPKYGRVYYDSIHHHYYRIIRHAPLEGASSREINHPQYTFTVCDTNFNVVGEGILPLELGKEGKFIPIFVSNGVYFWNREKSEQLEDSTVFTFYQIEFLKDSKQDKLKKEILSQRTMLRADIKEEGLLNYLHKELKIGAEKQALLLIPLEHSCATCVENVGKYIQENIVYIQSKGIKVVLISSNSSNARAYIEKYNTDENKDFFVIDDKNKILNYLTPWVNPRWLVVTGDKVIEDIIFNPSEIPLLEKSVNYYKK